jgi:hypothetical protein
MPDDEKTTGDGFKKPTEMQIDDAKNDVSWAVREMTSNLLRVLRGAGRPYDIGRLANETVRAFVSHQKIVGVWPNSDELAKMLAVGLEDRMLNRDDSSRRLADADLTIIRGVLQVCASRLIGQTTQVCAGASEMGKGLKYRDDIRDDLHRRDATVDTDAEPLNLREFARKLRQNRNRS